VVSQENKTKNPRSILGVVLQGGSSSSGFLIWDPRKEFPSGGRGVSRVAQVSSMKSTTKLFRFLIDHQRSTVILSRWIGIYRRYRPWSINRVYKSVDSYRHLDSYWDHFSPPMGPWLFCRCVYETISHQQWDYMGTQVNGPFFPDFSEEIDRCFFWYESTSTVDFDRFLAEIDGRCDIDRIFKHVKSYRLSISTIFSDRRILINRR